MRMDEKDIDAEQRWVTVNSNDDNNKFLWPLILNFSFYPLCKAIILTNVEIQNLVKINSSE